LFSMRGQGNTSGRTRHFAMSGLSPLSSKLDHHRPVGSGADAPREQKMDDFSGLSGPAGATSTCSRGAACIKAGRKSHNDEDDKFSLPMGSGLIEDVFEVAPRGFITDIEFDRGGLKCVSLDQTKR
jgi:hypothetical protein